MEELDKYIKHHTVLLAFVITLAFGVLYAGEIYLYKQTVYLNKMISEGLMQIKEENRNMMMPSPSPMVSSMPKPTEKGMMMMK